MATSNQYFPQSIPHPGETLAEKLKEMGMGPEEFANLTGQLEKTITDILNGSKSITPEIAIILEKFLEIPVRFWLQNQSDYNEFNY